MDYSKQNVSNYYLYDTQVENLFLSEYMASAPGDFVKAYLLAAMYAQLNMPADDRMIARSVGMPPEKMGECWAYWEGRGVVRRLWDDPEDPSGFRVEFVNLKEEVFGSREPAKKQTAGARLDDRALARLYRDIEAATGRMLDSREPELIATLLTEYGMTPEFILYGYRFCAEKRKSSRGPYVQKILIDWKSKGFTAPAQVQEYLDGMDRHYDLQRQIFRALGFNRSATEEEKRIMNKWFDDYGFDVDKIKEACSKTAGISNPNINYVDAVLTAWYKESGKAPEDDKELVTSKIERMYEKDRTENAAKTEAIRREVFTKIPRTKAIMEELRSCSINVSRYMLMGESGKASAAAERAKIEALRKERTRLLTDAGYGPDALDQIYTCSKCKDTGLLEDGRRCSCYGEKLRLLTDQEGQK